MLVRQWTVLCVCFLCLCTCNRRLRWCLKFWKCPNCVFVRTCVAERALSFNPSSFCVYTLCTCFSWWGYRLLPGSLFHRVPRRAKQHLHLDQSLLATQTHTHTHSKKINKTHMMKGIELETSLIQQYRSFSGLYLIWSRKPPSYFFPFQSETGFCGSRMVTGRSPSPAPWGCGWTGPLRE